MLINLILSNESSYNSDVNGDGILNVLDAIELADIIFNNYSFSNNGAISL